MAQPRILVAFHSSEGQSAKIATYVSDKLGHGGAAVDLQPVGKAPSPAGYDAVVLGDPIHMSHHSQELTEYLRQHAGALKGTPSALFQVSITSIGTDTKHVEEAQDLLRQLTDKTGFAPDVVGLFGGALAYTRYGWLKRRVVRAIAKGRGLETDTTRDHEYTDWASVDRFAAEVLALTAPVDVGAPVSKTGKSTP